jgi:hypothetical protein
MSVVSESAKSVSAAALKKATALIAEAMELLGGAAAKKGKKTAAEKTKGTNRGLVKLALQRQAALAILISEWEERSEEERSEMVTVAKVSKAGKETSKEVPVHPKPTYKDVIALFKKGERPLPEVTTEAVDEAWVAAQAKRELALSVASASDVDASEPDAPAAEAKPKPKAAAPKPTAAAPKPTAAAPKPKPTAAAPKPKADAAAPKPTAAAPKPTAAAGSSKGAPKDKVITKMKTDEDIDCTVFEFKGKNYLRRDDNGHCWTSLKDSDGDWSFGQWAGIWLGNSIDASVADPDADEDEDDEEEEEE